MSKPATKPACPNFSSGPCAKRPGYDLAKLPFAATAGRSHRSGVGKKALKEAIDLSKKILGLPEGYRLGIVPASDTGAVEMFLWSALGPRGVDVFHWESFGQEWMTDITKQLKLKDVRVFTAPYGQLPDMTQAAKDRDVIFTWNGTTSGVRVNNADFIADDREGLAICDATSSCFAMEMPWEKLDVVTFSWQKVLGSEGAHGVLILSPRAVARLESFTPDRPLPKIFRMTKGGKVTEDLFEGATINTPSMLAVADYLDALKWAESIGGFPALKARTEANFAAVARFVEKTPWIHFLAKDAALRSTTSVCLTLDLADDKVTALVKLLDKEAVGYDLGAYRDAPPGLRIWCGATVQTADVEALLPWIEWAYSEVQKG